MHKRYLDCSASELLSISKSDLLDALRASEGRIVVSETIGAVQPLLHSVTNAELAASQGADLLLLNMFDVDNPVIHGMPDGTEPANIIHTLRYLTGRVIGVNLEAVDPALQQEHREFWSIREGRQATAENAHKLVTMGAKFLVLTGNPGNRITNRAITSSLRAIHAAIGEKAVLIAGKCTQQVSFLRVVKTFSHKKTLLSSEPVVRTLFCFPHRLRFRESPWNMRESSLPLRIKAVP